MGALVGHSPSPSLSLLAEEVAEVAAVEERGRKG